LHGEYAFSHTDIYLNLLLKEQPYRAESTFLGGAFELVLQNLSTCLWNFTCRI